jgi:RHS repeat-associated protein
MSNRRWPRLRKAFPAIRSVSIASGIFLMSTLLAVLPAATADASPTVSNAITYVYDQAGRLEAAIDPTVSAGGQGLVRYAYDDAGNITSISRADSTVATVVDFKGSSGQVGSSVTIYGAGFDATPANDTVKFNGSGGVAGTVTSASSTVLAVTVPSGATTGPIYAKNNTTGLSSTSAQTFTVSGSAAPTITSISPTSGVAGDSITIPGTNFATDPTADDVYFNGIRARVTAATQTQLTVSVPPGATSGTVEVHTAGGIASSSQDFIIYPSGSAANYDLVTRMTIGQSTNISLGATKSGLILVNANQADWFSLYFTNNAGFSNFWHVNVTDPFGRKATKQFDVSGSPVVGKVNDVPAAGDYEILITNGNTGTSSATLTLYNINPASGGNVQPSVGGTVVSMALANPGQWGEFTFDATANHKIELDITGGNGSSEALIHTPSAPLYVDVPFSDFTYGGGLPAFGPVLTLPETGNYVVWVGPFGASQWTGTLQVTLYDKGIAFSRHRGAVWPQQEAAAPAPAASSQSDRDLRKLLRGYHPPYSDSWAPDPKHLDQWTTGRAPSPFQTVPLHHAPPGVTAIAGHVLGLSGRPVTGVTVSVGGVMATTDFAGRFLLQGVQPGSNNVFVDGSTARVKGEAFGSYGIAVDAKGRTTTEIDYPIWLSAKDSRNEVHIQNPLPNRLVLTNPSMPEFELVFPKGSTLTNENGNPVTKVGLTPIPLDRGPFPMPVTNPFFMRWMVQPGPLHVSGPGAEVIYANYRHMPVGYQLQVWKYEPDGGAWEIYGQARVSRDGRHIVPDPGVRFDEIAGAGVTGKQGPQTNPDCGGSGDEGASAAPSTETQNCSSDPVDMSNGVVRMKFTDLVEPGPLPIRLLRIYRQNDGDLSYPFGLSMPMRYDMSLWSPHLANWFDLQIPGQRTVHFVPPVGQTGPPMFVSDRPGRWQGARLDVMNILNGSQELVVRRRDGTVYTFDDVVDSQMNGALVEIRDRFGNLLVINRDPQLRVSSVVSYPTGRWISLSYDTNSHVTSATDPLGRSVTYTYENPATGVFRLKTVTDAKQNSLPQPAHTTLGWDTSTVVNANSTGLPSPGTQLESITDNRGNVALQTHFDSSGRVDLQTLANGGTYAFNYANAACGGSPSVTDPTGNITCRTFDANGYASSVTYGAGTSLARTLSYQRDPTTKQVSSVTDSFTSAGNPITRTVSFSYFPNGDVQTITAPGGGAASVTTSYQYNGYSQRSRVTDPLTHATQFGYTNGCLTSITDALTNSLTLQCNNHGEPTSISDSYNDQSSLAYDHGDLQSVTDALGRTNTTFSDDAGRVLSVRNPYGEQTQNQYDPLSKLTKVIDPRGKSVSLAYDANENLTSVSIDATGSTIGYGYNAMNEVQSRTDPLSHQETLTYDLGGNLTKLTDRKGQVIKYCYDAINHLSFVGYKATNQTPACNTNKYESTTTFTTDPGGRLTKEVDSAAGTITRTYFLSDLLKKDTTPQGAVSYTYDDAGRRQTMTAGNQAQVSYSYFANNLFKNITQGSNVVSFTYDNANRLATETLPNADVQTYTDDAASEVTKISYDNGATNLGLIKYAYDTAGRRSTVWGSWARLGLPSATTSNATYNGDNQLTGWNGTTLGYDTNGNLTSFGSQTYTWNARNQLTATSGGSASFAYDGLGRRISRTAGGTTTKYLYDGLNPVQEQNASGSVTANEITGLGLDKTYWRNDLGNGTTRSLLTDVQGSVVAGVDGTGLSVQAAYTYTPFGQQTATLGSQETNPFQYTGREWDGTTGLQFSRARYYNPTLGRFVSEDPLDVGGGAANLYEYSGDQPCIATDPLGFSSCGFFCFLGEHWAQILILFLDVAALALTVYGFGLWLFPVASELSVFVTGATAAYPWLVLGTSASIEGLATSIQTGSPPGDLRVTGATNLVPFLAPEVPVLSVAADAYQFGYDWYRFLHGGSGR